MNEPELKFEIDEHGCIGYRVTNEGVLLSKDEKELIIDHVMRLQDENAKLREELDQWHSLTAGIELPEYPITQFQPKDLERENAKLRHDLEEANNQAEEVCIENAKLRELVKYAYECAIHSDHATCNDCERMNGCCILVDRMRELRVEVGE